MSLGLRGLKCGLLGGAPLFELVCDVALSFSEKAFKVLMADLMMGSASRRGAESDPGLDLDLKDSPCRVARLHVNDGQFVVEGLALVRQGRFLPVDLGYCLSLPGGPRRSGACKPLITSASREVPHG